MDNRLIAYSSSRREIDGEERTFRTRIGVAFPHKRAEVYTILIKRQHQHRRGDRAVPPVQ